MKRKGSGQMSELESFTEKELIVLRRLAGAMIGASEELQIPGADDDAIFSRFLERAGSVVAGLGQGMDDCFAEIGGTSAVAALDDADFVKAIDVFQHKQHPFLEAMTGLVAYAYYRDPRILRSLNKEDRPPFPEGNELEQGDWSLLDPVRRRDPFFRV